MSSSISTPMLMKKTVLAVSLAIGTLMMSGCDSNEVQSDAAKLSLFVLHLLKLFVPV